jgi:hypothetical protein
VYVGLASGEVLVFQLRALAQGPMSVLGALRCEPLHSLVLLPDAIGGGLLAASAGGLACYLPGRPAGRAPVPARVAAAGAGECVAATWDAAAGAAVASMRGQQPALRHVYVLPQPLVSAKQIVGRGWRCGGAVADAGAAPPNVACRAAAVPARGGADVDARGALLACGDEARRCVALWQSGSGSGGAQQPVQRLAPHDDGPVLDVRVCAAAAARADGAGRLLLSLSAGQLRVHARSPQVPEGLPQTGLDSGLTSGR